jgi:hypothetical protein
MRPVSIRRFDLFYLASLALQVIAFVVNYDALVASVEARTAAAGMQMGAGLAIGSFAVGMAISLLLWFLVSRKRLAIAKWLVVLLFVISLFGVPGLVSGEWTVPKVLSLVADAAMAAAVFYLFRADTRAWLAGEASADTAAGD